MRKISGLIAAVLLLLISAANAYSQTYFAAKLSQAQQYQSGSKADSIDRGYTGSAVLILSSDSSNNATLNFMITVGRGTPGNDTSQIITPGGITQGDSSKLRAIYFRMGSIGDTGTTVISITSGFTGNSYTGTWNSGGNQGLTTALVDALLSGKVFIVAVLDSGQIRGHIHPVNGAGFVAHLTGPQEADSVVTKASGVGSFLLTDFGLIYQISVQGIDIQASHFHMGMPGISGNIVKPITFNGHTAIGLWKMNDQSNPLTRDLMTMLLTEGLYVNVHSPSHPGGEIRGQVLHAAGFGFSSQLNSSKASQGGNTGNMSDSTRIVGSGTYTLTDFGLVYHINLRGKKSATNIHFANNSTNQKLKDIPVFSDTTVSGVWYSKTGYETSALSGANVADLLQGRISLVVETANDTMKGVVMLHKQTNFSALLSGPQERPRHMIHPTGGGHFILTPTGLQYYITLAGIDSITGAHFHMAPVGVNGPIVHSITFDSTFTAQGTWNMTPDSTGMGSMDNMIDALLKGEIYVNVHTRTYPEGAIRGQLVPASGTDFTLNLTGSQVMPATMEKAVGTGNFILTNEGLTYKITLDSLNVTGIRIEQGPFGVNGKVVNDLNTAGFDTSKTIVGVWRRTGGTSPLSDQLITALLRGNLYVNILTSANPNGALRGQILPNGGSGFVAMFDSATAGQGQMAGSGKGTAIFVLTDAGLLYDIAVAGYTGNAGSITMGQGGTSVFQLEPTFNGGATNGVWLMLNDTTNAANNLAALFNNQLFVNLTGGPSAPIGRTFTPNPTSVSLIKASPESFDLGQNYPNPFNPTTTIRFSIPSAGNVSLHIYNVIGQKVATLVDGQLRAGQYEVSFDGSRIASGVYFYRISFQNNIVTKKMMLVK
ncbi:MAG: CHRD domain-containing protein [Ignavibacteria bacterium]|jgi:hypothetical protein|nr:CHRD domain-containing protein [Ignavibacteria bacterium]MCU7504298.1 CHRD domain-containing protein [Ignavibacteria bacterium]MCU7516143.1 CHRD domain-containing protein [Ignavibacteria bacterium]